MTINFEYHDVEASERLEEFTKEKLEHLYKKFNMIVRADVFFRLKQGEFITYADGKDKKVQFKLSRIQRQLPEESKQFSQADLAANFERVYEEARSIFN